MSTKKLIEWKHPTAWIEFEKGMISEAYTVPTSRDCFYIFFQQQEFTASEIFFGLRHICIDKSLISEVNNVNCN